MPNENNSVGGGTADGVTGLGGQTSLRAGTGPHRVATRRYAVVAEAEINIGRAPPPPRLATRRYIVEARRVEGETGRHRRDATRDALNTTAPPARPPRRTRCRSESGRTDFSLYLQKYIQPPSSSPPPTTAFPHSIPKTPSPPNRRRTAPQLSLSKRSRDRIGSARRGAAGAAWLGAVARELAPEKLFSS